MDQPDSLEDWVAIKEHPFIDTGPQTRLQFHVAWNHVERKLAITSRECNRTATSDKEDTVNCDLFTFQDIYGVHQQLSLVKPSLGPYLPDLPLEPRGIWAYLQNFELENEIETCLLIENYLKIALEVCGQKLLISTLYENHELDEYFENISMLKKKKYEEAVENAEDQLNNVLFLRDNSTNVLDMCEVYYEEDKAWFKWSVAFAELYNYQLQPFMDLREVAFNKIHDAKMVLETGDIGDRVRRECSVVISEWQQHYVHALDMISQLYLQYYEVTVEKLMGLQERMNVDKSKFGKVAFEMKCQDRLDRIEEDLCLDKIQFLQMRKKQLEQERDKVKQEIASVEEKPGCKKEVDRLETLVYNWQLKIYNSRIDVLAEEEKLKALKVQTFKRQLKEAREEEENMFHDAVEDLEALSSDDEESNAVNSVEAAKLRSLQAQLAGIRRRKATLRNKKKELVDKKQLKDQEQVEKEEQLVKHHSVHFKIKARQEDNKDKEDFIAKERKKTIERLKEYKKKIKHPSAKMLKAHARSPKPTDQTYKVDTEPHSKEKGRKRDKVDGDVTTITDDSIQPLEGTTSLLPMQATVPLPPSSSAPAVGPPIPQPPPVGPPIPPPPPIGPPMPPPPPVGPPVPPPPPIGLPVPPPPPIGPPTRPGGTPKTNSGGSKAAKPKHDQAETSQGLDLGNILAARGKLKKRDVTPSRKEEPGAGDQMADMMNMIRLGVKLRKTNRDEEDGRTPQTRTPTEPHLQMLMDRLQSIQESTGPSSGEESDHGSFDD